MSFSETLQPHIKSQDELTFFNRCLINAIGDETVKSKEALPKTFLQDTCGKRLTKLRRKKVEKHLIWAKDDFALTPGPYSIGERYLITENPSIDKTIAACEESIVNYINLQNMNVGIRPEIIMPDGEVKYPVRFCKDPTSAYRTFTQEEDGTWYFQENNGERHALSPETTKQIWVFPSPKSIISKTHGWQLSEEAYRSIKNDPRHPLCDKIEKIADTDNRIVLNDYAGGGFKLVLKGIDPLKKQLTFSIDICASDSDPRQLNLEKTPKYSTTVNLQIEGNKIVPVEKPKQTYDEVLREGDVKDIVEHITYKLASENGHSLFNLISLLTSLSPTLDGVHIFSGFWGDLWIGYPIWLCFRW